MRKKPPVVYLDEIDVIQMAYAAVEVFPKETFGLIWGSIFHSKTRNIYKTHFIQIIQGGHRTEKDFNHSILNINNKNLDEFKSFYNFKIIGDYHSHTNKEARFSASELPARRDIISSMKVHGSNTLIGIVTIEWDRQFEYCPRLLIERKTNSITCHLNQFEIGIHFYTFRSGVTRISMNKKYMDFIEKTDVRCLIRKKLHLERGSTLWIK